MKFYYGFFLVGFVLFASTTFSPAYDTLSHKLERKAPVTGQVIKLNTGNVAQLIGKRSIVMDTCRQLKGKALILQGTDGHGYELPDGVYQNSQRVQIHIRKGRIDRISFSAK